MSTITITIDSQPVHEFDKAGLRYHTTTNDVKVGKQRAYPFTLTTKNGNKYTFYSADMQRANKLVQEFHAAENATLDFPAELNTKYAKPVASTPGPHLIITLAGTKFLDIPVDDMRSVRFSGSPDATKPQTVTIEIKNQDPYVDNVDSEESNTTYIFNVASDQEGMLKSSDAGDMMNSRKPAGTIDFDPALNTHLMS